MVDISRSPPREGTRGGLELFKWEDVKSQTYKDREAYLGQSLKLGVASAAGKFYKHDWWTKKKEDGNIQLLDEQEVAKRFDEELIKEALGEKPHRLLLQKATLSMEQKRALLASDETESKAKDSKKVVSNEVIEKNRRKGKTEKKNRKHNRDAHSKHHSSNLKKVKGFHEHDFTPSTVMTDAYCSPSRRHRRDSHSLLPTKYSHHRPSSKHSHSPPAKKRSRHSK